MKRMKIETAGRLVRCMIYRAALPSDAEGVRKEKVKCSSAARRAMNLRLSWQKLEVLLAENFELTDLVVTLTYRDSCLPFSKAQAETRLKRFIRQLRASRRLRGDVILYVYCTEGRHGDHRLHHHIVLNATDADYEEIRALWAENGDNVDFDTIAKKGYDGWAQYLTKEPRREGSRVGERTWVPCMGLRRPVAVSENCSDDEELTVPEGAVVLERSSKQNEYGEYVYLKYLLPQRAVPLEQKENKTA